MPFTHCFKISLTLFLLLQIISPINGQTNLVTYAGNDAKEAFHDIVQLSDGTFLVGGYAQNLDWVANDVPKTQLDAGSINNAQGSNQFGFILQLSENLQEMLHLVHFPQGAVEDVRFIKMTNLVGQPTGDLFISGNTEDTKSNDGGYFLAKLNDNFVNGIPDGLEWERNIWAEGYPKINHPWDVGSDGKIVYVRGQSHAFDWSAAHRLDENGEREPVENWRIHWLAAGGEFYGDANELPNGTTDIDHSGIVFKTAGRCELRSWTMDDYTLNQPDENGGTKVGKWPLDAFFDAPCDPDNPSGNGPGYTGYRLGDTFVQGPASVVIDRRDNAMYLGMNFKSKLPDGNPDFEPTVLAMDATGQLKWWSRLYHEITPAGDTVNSSPDQYIDALAIDYSTDLDEGMLVVNARCHGNNVENLWEGDNIFANAAASGFQNQFTGSSGNIHISWLGKMQLQDGQLLHSTYVAEYAEGATGLTTPHPDPNLDNWPNPNAGWPTLNTTRLARNNIKVSADGQVCILGVGRRTITTANAYQKMVLPENGGLSAWNSFVRVYESNLSLPLYSSLVVGVWDTLTQQGGGNTVLQGVWKTADGVIAVGFHQEDEEQAGVAKGNDIPTTNVPIWGQAAADNQSAILVKYVADNLINDADDANTGDVSTTELTEDVFDIFPNPTNDLLNVHFKNRQSGEIWLTNAMGQVVFKKMIQQQRVVFEVKHFPKGFYYLNFEDEKTGLVRTEKIVLK